MEIKKLSFSSSIWANFDKNLNVKICKINGKNTVVEYFKGVEEKATFILSGKNLQYFNDKLCELKLEKWDCEYYDYTILDGEEWQIEVMFSNGKKNIIKGMNGYPKNWNAFLELIKWLERVYEEKKTLTYEEAKEKALSINPKVNFCREYLEAYHFFELGGEAKTPDNDVVVIKKTGKIFNFTTFVITFKPEHNAKTIKF